MVASDFYFACEGTKREAVSFRLIAAILSYGSHPIACFIIGVRFNNPIVSCGFTNLCVCGISLRVLQERRASDIFDNCKQNSAAENNILRLIVK